MKTAKKHYIESHPEQGWIIKNADGHPRAVCLEEATARQIVSLLDTEHQPAITTAESSAAEAAGRLLAETLGASWKSLKEDGKSFWQSYPTSVHRLRSKRDFRRLAAEMINAGMAQASVESGQSPGTDAISKDEGRPSTLASAIMNRLAPKGDSKRLSPQTIIGLIALYGACALLSAALLWWKGLI